MQGFRTIEALARGVRNQDQRAVARAITLVENRTAAGVELLRLLYRHTGGATIIGITGSPGAGKSTLTDQLAAEWSKRRKRVAVLAVDPSSPFSGGAVLGDRVRMAHSEQVPGIFIRSMASRGALGGIAAATIDAARILDAAGYGPILIETVGVGQGEVDVARCADTTLVVLVPGMGDSVQALKAGIMEIADHFIINKADRHGVEELQRDLRNMLGLRRERTEWTPQIVRSVATTGEGIPDIIAAVDAHRKWLTASGAGTARRRMIMEHTLTTLAGERIKIGLLASPALLKALAIKCIRKDLDPYRAVDLLLAAARKSII